MAATKIRTGQIDSADGWTPDNFYTWVYASASTFTIAGVDLTTTFTKGTRLKFTQTTVKYAVVVSSSFSTNTTVTIAVNTDYTIANAAISLNYYSYQAKPQGYPYWFTFAAAATGWAATPTTYESRFSVIGNTVMVKYGISGTSNATTASITNPVASSNTTSSGGNYSATGFAQDGGASLTTPALIEVVVNSTTVNFYKTYALGAWTNTGGKRIDCVYWYEF